MAFLRALRRLLTLALIAGVGLMLCLVYLIPRLPPQDLPWTPLDLDAPIGLATAGKIAATEGPACRLLLDKADIAYRPEGPACRLLLDKADIAYRPVAGPRRGTCDYDDGVTWAPGGRRHPISATSQPVRRWPVRSRPRWRCGSGRWCSLPPNRGSARGSSRSTIMGAIRAGACTAARLAPGASMRGRGRSILPDSN